MNNIKIGTNGSNIKRKKCRILEREREAQERKDYLNNSESIFKNHIGAIYLNSQFPYLNVWSVIRFQCRHDVWRPLCIGFTLAQIICNPGGKCAFCTKANRKHIWAQIKRMITTLYTLYPLLGPQGSHSVCLGTFSLAAFGGTGWEKHHHHPQNPQQRVRAEEMDNLQRCTSFKSAVLQTLLWGKLSGEASQGSHGGLCWVCGRSAWPSAGGATPFSFQSLASSQLSG